MNWRPLLRRGERAESRRGRRPRRNSLSTGLAIIPVAFALFGGVADLHARQCAACDVGISGDCYLITDRVTGLAQVICERCILLNTRCYLCGMPVKNDLMTLGDGRVLCARDSKNVVLSDDEAKRDCADARDELDRLFSRFTTFPKTNVTVVMVDRTQMDQLMQTPGFDRQCPSVNGYIRSRVVAGGEWKHPINILNGLPKYRLMAVCAHEFGHAWVRENLPPSRDIDRDSEEGFCELIAYKLMERFNQRVQMDTIKNNLYTRGQFDLLLEADTTYGFYTVVQWMKCGTDNCLRAEEPDRIRKIDERRLLKPRPESPAAPLVFAPTPVPDALTLIGILGGGTRRLALINDRSFGVSESGKVRVGPTNVTVRCLELRSNSVLIEVDGFTEKQELFLKSK